MVGPLLLVLAGCGEPPAPALVILALDNTRWDYTSLGDPAHDRTPSLREFAALPGSVTFERAYAAAPFSIASYSSLFTGRDAPKHGVGFRTMTVPEDATTMAEVLGTYGWRSAAFTGGAHLAAETRLGQGFAAFEDNDALSPFGRQATDALAWLDEARTDAPLFLFVHGYDAHIPYTAPSAMAERYDPAYTGPVHAVHGVLTMDGIASIRGGVYAGNPDAFNGLPPDEPRPRAFPLAPADLAHVAAHYGAAVRKGDYHLGEFLRALESRGIFDRAIVVVLGDHGEELGEAGAFQHGNSLGDNVLHVPVVVHFPGDTRPPRTWPGVVSLVDLLPTLLGALDIVPPAGIDGRDLRPELDGSVAPADVPARAATSKQVGVRDRDWLLVGDSGPGGPSGWALYRDGEGADVAATEPAVVARLAASLSGWPDEPGTDALVVTDAMLADKLRDGGYWVRRSAGTPVTSDAPVGPPPEPPAVGPTETPSAAAP